MTPSDIDIEYNPELDIIDSEEEIVSEKDITTFDLVID
jgi:hypothetical protein